MINSLSHIFILFLIGIFLPLNSFGQQEETRHDLKTMISQDEFDEYLYRAVMNFIDLNDVQAAENLRRAADMILTEKEENLTFEGGVYMAIGSSMIEFSKELSQSSINSIQTVSNGIGLINYQLADYYLNFAKNEFQNDHVNNSLLYLESASYFFVVSAKWNGNEVSEGIRIARKSIDKMKKKLKAGEAIDVKELQKNLNFIEQEIARFAE